MYSGHFGTRCNFTEVMCPFSEELYCHGAVEIRVEMGSPSVTRMTH